MSDLKAITEDDLQAYVDGALDARRTTEVADYLTLHPEVGQRVARDIALRNALRRAVGPIADEPVPAELSVSRMVEQRRRGPWFQSAGWRAAAAAVLLLAGGAGGWFARAAQQAPAAGIPALMQEAADSYAVYAPDSARPVELVAADKSQLLDWAGRRLDRRMIVPDLSRAGFRFMGGRVVPTSHGPAVLYVFDNAQGARLMMLSRNMAVDRDASMREYRSDALQSVTWARNGLGFSLVGPAGQDGLRTIADSAKAQLSPDA